MKIIFNYYGFRMLLCKCLLTFQVAQSPGDPVYETVVTGTRSARRLKDAPVATEVLNRDDMLRSGAENLGSVLEDHPGVEVVRSFSGAGIRIQGLDPAYVLILVDGERITGRVNGTVDASTLTAETAPRACSFAQPRRAARSTMKPEGRRAVPMRGYATARDPCQKRVV